ncbi:MAG: VOC family protein [Hyphomicrobiales bacterium]|nr:VOC family protein [Hyphomicrobiales bacterium]MBV8826284.1 VOC family protein [Hyphomicrobiales bacterium]MBV9429723.1 VOC family protein [Bradyrhizobiaceae bacterium]
MIDHVSLGVADLDRAARFYEAVLGAVGFAKLEVRPATIGFGKRYPEFWLNHRPSMGAVPTDTGVHVCVRARTAEAVDAFHRTALAAGGVCEGAPGVRPHRTGGYYAAFVRDLDGNRIEAVTFLTRDG